MSETESKTRFKPFLFIVLLAFAIWHIIQGMQCPALTTAPSDLSFTASGTRSVLVFVWVFILMLTPTTPQVFYSLFLGFSGMFLSNLIEWFMLLREIPIGMQRLFEMERISSVVFVTLGLGLWSYERRRDDLSLRTLSATDSLTGLYNTRYFYQELENEIRRVRRYGRELALVLIRVDHFKEYNTKHGYGEGDRVLKEMGESILGYLRRSDLGCRFGANEFAILLPETPTAGAALVGQRLQDRLRDLEFVVGGERHRMGLTVAVVHLKNEEASLGLVRRAEKLLEEATSQGGGVVLKD